MSELSAWMIVLGLAATLVCMVMLSRKLDAHARTTTEIILRSNEMMLARLERLADPSRPAPELEVGVVLERRHAERRDLLAARTGNGLTDHDQRDGSGLPGRRLEDMLLAVDESFRRGVQP